MKNLKSPPPHLTSHIGYWMRMVSNHVSYAFARKLAASDVTVAEWVVLREMYGAETKIAPSAIATLTGLTRGAVSKLVDRLLEKKLVTRKDASGDRRFQEIELTPKALLLTPKLAALADENDEEFFAALTKAERKTLTHLLRKVADTHQLKTAPIS